MYDRQTAMMRKWSVAVSGPQNRPSTGVHRRGKTVPSRAECRHLYTRTATVVVVVVVVLVVVVAVA